MNNWSKSIRKQLSKKCTTVTVRYHHNKKPRSVSRKKLAVTFSM